jgi:hypothetical protein
MVKCFLRFLPFCQGYCFSSKQRIATQMEATQNKQEFET